MELHHRQGKIDIENCNDVEALKRIALSLLESNKALTLMYRMTAREVMGNRQALQI